MTYTIPGCYTTAGAPVAVPNASDVIRPAQHEEPANPSPRRAAANLAAGLALPSPAHQPGML